MQGLWDCESLDQFFFKLLRAGVDHKAPINFTTVAHYLKNRFLNLQRGKAFNLKHYEIGNDLYKKMLDKRLVYTCGFWQDAKDLDEAQEAKLELVCRKIGLKPGMKILDIGCGWGSFMKYAVEKYQASCVGVTISQAQIDLGKELCKGLPIEFRLQDYRDITGQFDAIVSLGMFEHVGYKNYKTYMHVANKCLKDDGLFLLHTIGSVSSKESVTSDPWTNKYIFTQGALPSVQQIARSTEELFMLEDFHNFGAYYDNTLMTWYENFQKSWPELKSEYDETFFRMWKYYLLSCAGSFRARKIQLWQIVLSKNGVLGGYKSIRSLVK